MVPVQALHGASGLPVAPDVCQHVPGSSPCRCGSPSRGPIKTRPALSAVFAACQTVWFMGFISGGGGLHMGSVFYRHWLSVKARDHDLSDTQ